MSDPRVHDGDWIPSHSPDQPFQEDFAKGFKAGMDAALSFFVRHRDCELKYGGTHGQDRAWTVLRFNDVEGDRGYRLVARGETPGDAMAAAMGVLRSVAD